MKTSTFKRKIPLKKVNSKRRAREKERAYGSLARRQWVSDLPCSVPGCTGRPCENAHVNPDGHPSDGPSGMGRKHDYTQIVPLCGGHHNEYHNIGQWTFNTIHRLDVDLIAIMIQDRWLEEQDAA